MKQLLFLLMFLCSTHMLPFSITGKPVAVVYTPNSILEHKEKYQPFCIAGKTRYATCTGAAWFHKNYLAVLNLYGRKIITYKFDPDAQRFSIVQELGSEAQLPENMTVSPDGTLLAICSDCPTAGTQFYAIDQNSHLIQATPIFSLPAYALVHNIRFTSDGIYFATAGWDAQQSVCIYKLTRHEKNVSAQLVHSIKNTTAIKAKGVHFTKDSRFLVVCYSSPVMQTHQSAPYTVLLASYKFDPLTGTIGEPVSRQQCGGCTEDLAFLNNDHEIMLSDQGNDRLIRYPFDPATGHIGDTHTFLQGLETQLSFPHGIGIAPSEDYFVVCNYGDDKFNLYRIDH
jgi:hypothetical protein